VRHGVSSEVRKGYETTRRGRKGKKKGGESDKGSCLTEPPEFVGGVVSHGAGAAETPKTVMAAMMAFVNCMLMV
jgi:hypothetical protein